MDEDTKKGKSWNLITMIAIVLTIGLILSSVGYGIALSDKNNMKEKYNGVKEKYDSINSSYNSLQRDYNSLNQSYNSLQTNHTNLKQSYASLQSNYSSLNSQYISVQQNYNTLQGSYATIQSQYNTLHSNYNSLQSQYNSLQSNYNSLQSQYNSLQSNYSNLELEYNSLQNKYGILNNSYTSLQFEYSNLQSNYTQLNNSYNSLQSDYNGLESQFNLLQSNYTGLQNDYNALQSNYNSLQSNYNSLQGDYNNLNNEYDTLEDQYITLETNYNTLNANFNIESTMRIGHLLSDYYEVIRKNYMPVYKQDKVDFAAEIAGHGLGRIYWPAYEDEFYDASYTAYGNYIHSYTEAYDELVEVKNLIGINSYDSDVTKVKKILDFIVDNIHYEGDMDDNFLGPMETAGLKSGDCEDFSILAGALFEMAGIESAIAFGYTSGGYHAYLLVQMEDLGSYDCWYYDDLTGYGLSPGKWVIIEPQHRIDQQYYSLENYSLDVAAEIEN